MADKVTDYGDVLIKSTIYNQDPTLFEIIDRKESFLFDENQEILYNILKGMYLKNDVVPSAEILDAYFKYEKLNPAKGVWEHLRLDAVEPIKDIKILTDLALSIIIKGKTKQALKATNNSLNIKGNSNVYDILESLQDTIGEFKEALENDQHTELYLEGEQAANEYRLEYEKRKNGNTVFLGKYGIESIDRNVTGYERSDLIHIAGFTNQGKSPLLRFLAYQALLQGLNVVFFTLEISSDRIRDQFYTLHANNGQRFGFNNPKITSDKLKRGELTPDEENFLLNQVIPDFTTAADMGLLYILQPDGEYTFDDMCLKVRRINKTVMPVDVLALDYATLLLPSSNVSRVDTTTTNIMLRRLRQFGLSFKKANCDKPGLMILNAAQTNRTGFEEACKHPQNLYDLSALGQYNSLEKDATAVYSVLQTNDMKAAGEVQVQPLKLRDGKFFPPFKMIFDGETGFYYETNQKLTSEDKADIIASIDL